MVVLSVDDLKSKRGAKRFDTSQLSLMITYNRNVQVIDKIKGS